METKTSVATINLMYQDLMKLDRFDGTNFTCWHDKLKFILLVYFGVGMYFGKTKCFQIGVLLWCSNIGYIWQVYFWHQNDLGFDMLIWMR